MCSVLKSFVTRWKITLESYTRRENFSFILFFIWPWFQCDINYGWWTLGDFNVYNLDSREHSDRVKCRKEAKRGWMLIFYYLEKYIEIERNAYFRYNRKFKLENFVNYCVGFMEESTTPLWISHEWSRTCEQIRIWIVYRNIRHSYLVKTVPNRVIFRF